MHGVGTISLVIFIDVVRICWRYCRCRCRCYFSCSHLIYSHRMHLHVFAVYIHRSNIRIVLTIPIKSCILNRVHTHTHTICRVVWLCQWILQDSVFVCLCDVNTIKKTNYRHRHHHHRRCCCCRCHRYSHRIHCEFPKTIKRTHTPFKTMK